jgi:hypothetical protein
LDVSSYHEKFFFEIYDEDFDSDEMIGSRVFGIEFFDGGNVNKWISLHLDGKIMAEILIQSKFKKKKPLIVEKKF